MSEDHYIKENQLWPEVEYMGRSRTPVRLLAPMTKKEVLRSLKLPEDDPSSVYDLKYVLRRGNAMVRRGLDQARSLMSKDALKRLLTKDGSGLLMVDGHCKSDGAGKVSPLSVWSASFAASLKQSYSVVVLHFICGLHCRSDSDDPQAGPAGLIKSLMGDLIRQADTISRLGPLDRVLVNEVLEGNVESTVRLFKSLLVTVDTQKTVFIIIDSISEYEGVTSNDWYDQIRHVFTSLHDMVLGNEGNSEARTLPKVKVLVTSANKSIDLGRLVAEDEIVSLR